MTPLLFLLIFYFLFTKVIDLQIPRYATFVFIGIIVWGWTQTALLQAVTSISGNPGLVNQPSFPLPALPVIAVTSALLNLLIALPLMLALAWVEGARPSLALASLPLVIGVQFLLILGVAYLVAAVNVAFRDIEQVLPILLQLGYYITPVFFSLARVPPQFVPLFRANPMASLMTNYRRVVMDGSWPIWSELGLVLALALILLVVGIHYFQRARFRFLEEL
jgi:ABC-type polysaccharide/polyol phosphate export permease